MNDPVIDEIRRVRKVISAEVGPALEGMVERYAKLESRFAKQALTPNDRRSEVAKPAVLTLGNPPSSVNQPSSSGDR